MSRLSAQLVLPVRMRHDFLPIHRDGSRAFDADTNLPRIDSANRYPNVGADADDFVFTSRKYEQGKPPC
jgi:hypothetical protein